MTEQLLRIDASSVREWVYKHLYTVPTWHTFVVSRINTTSANVVKLRINWRVITESREDWKSSNDFFWWLVLNEDDSVEITHAFSWAQEYMTMSWSLVSNS